MVLDTDGETVLNLDAIFAASHDEAVSRWPWRDLAQHAAGDRHKQEEREKIDKQREIDRQSRVKASQRALRAQEANEERMRTQIASLEGRLEEARKANGSLEEEKGRLQSSVAVAQAEKVLLQELSNRMQQMHTAYFV